MLEIKKKMKQKIVFIYKIVFTESVLQKASSLHSLVSPLHVFRDPCFYFTFSFQSLWSIVYTSMSRVSLLFIYCPTL